MVQLDIRKVLLLLDPSIDLWMIRPRHKVMFNICRILIFGNLCMYVTIGT